MKKILLFGAGKSATVLIDYLLRHSLSENWMLTLVDANILLAKSKIGHALGGRAVSFDINNDSERRSHISRADIVISLLPPALHFLVAKDCLSHKKNLLTASYIDASMKELEVNIKESGLLFLCEMGLDPGIDHMSAKKLIDSIHEEGGKIVSFMSHCGGLVAPRSDSNPWHYKISWNPRNVVMAGKNGAVFKQNGVVISLTYKDLFSEKRFVKMQQGEDLCWYPNRDSLPYMSVYGLEDCPTFIRTTLRHPDFMYGWKNVIELSLTDETPVYQTDNKTLMDFFQEHFQQHNFQDWLQQIMQEQFHSSKKILQDLVGLIGMEEKRKELGDKEIDEFLMVNDAGSLEEVDVDDLKMTAAASVAEKMHDAKLTLKQLFYLGMNDKHTLIDKGICSAADVLQFALEEKLPLAPGDKDMVVMVHEIEWNKGSSIYRQASSMVVIGEDDVDTAMAKTVGLPLGIATKLILNGTIQRTGLCVPVYKDIYEPVLAELAKKGIIFSDTLTEC